ncbi:MAG: ABC transporter substrate-binding protein [Candidatus Thorarchaeota archaeon]
MTLLIKKKRIIALLILFSFLSIFWNTSENVVSKIVQSGPKPDKYWIDNQGYVDEIIFKVITQDALLINALREGEIDMMGSFIEPSLLIPADYNNPNLAITETRRRGFGHITFNTQKFPTSIRGLRQGFAYALDKQKIGEMALSGSSFMADSPIVGSMGIWSCEYQYAVMPCSPTGDTYYSARSDKGNQTIVNVGFYDQNGDGFREYYNGTIFVGENKIWDGFAVTQGAVVDSPSGYPDVRWNGYTYLGEDNIRRTFPQANHAAGGVLLAGGMSGIPYLANSLDSSKWVSVEFTLLGSSGNQVYSSVLTISSEAFDYIGLNVGTELFPFVTLQQIWTTGNFYGVLFGWTIDGVDPTFLQLFYSQNVQNQQLQRFANSTFDKDWFIIQGNSNYDMILKAALNAQQILWQEQPLVVAYNNLLISIYRTDKFEGQITVPGEGAFSRWSLVKVHVKNTYENWQNYPDFPLGGAFIYGLPQPIDLENLILATDVFSDQVLGLIQNKLFTYNPESLKPIASELASNWTIETPYSDPDLNNCPKQVCIINGSKFTFKLEDNVIWQDGTNFSSEDVKFSYELVKNQNNSELFEDIPLDRIETNSTDSNLITIYTNISSIFELEKLNIPIYEKSTWTVENNAFSYDKTIPIGTGPYKWQGAIQNESYQLLRNQNYYRQPVKNIPRVFGPDFPSPPPPTTDYSDNFPSLEDSTNNSFSFFSIFSFHIGNEFILPIMVSSFSLGVIIAIIREKMISKK